MKSGGRVVPELRSPAGRLEPDTSAASLHFGAGSRCDITGACRGTIRATLFGHSRLRESLTVHPSWMRRLDRHGTCCPTQTPILTGHAGWSVAAGSWPRRKYAPKDPASHPIRLESSLPADREPRTPAETIPPTRATRVRRSSRIACSARSARTNRKKGTSRKITCHQLRRQKAV